MPHWLNPLGQKSNSVGSWGASRSISTPCRCWMRTSTSNQKALFFSKASLNFVCLFYSKITPKGCLHICCMNEKGKSFNSLAGLSGSSVVCLASFKIKCDSFSTASHTPVRHRASSERSNVWFFLLWSYITWDRDGWLEALSSLTDFQHWSL